MVASPRDPRAAGDDLRQLDRDNGLYNIWSLSLRPWLDMDTSRRGR
jgi:hypothetical protein